MRRKRAVEVLKRTLRNATAVGALVGILVAATTSGTMAKSAEPKTGAEATCRPVSMTIPAEVAVSEPVSVPVPDADWTVRGTLCAPRGARAVQLLQSGATYGSQYWDFDYEPERYSYVRSANAAGFATLNVDRLGIGTSSHPEPGLLTTATEANIAHLLVQRLRKGSFGRAFDQVAIVGHSYGSVIGLAEAGTYRDIDALVATGFDHEVGPGFVSNFAASLAPAAIVEPSRFGRLDPTYLTTRPGTRSGFYYTPNADPKVIERDEATKQTFTVAEGVTFPAVLPESLRIDSPVYVVVGERDALFCGSISDCSSPLSLTSLERRFYPSASVFDFKAIPDAGHSLNLQQNAPETFALINGWLRENLG